MNVILLAAGFGTRLLPLTEFLPKCMMPIHDKPLLLYWLKIFDDKNIDKIVINTHYLSEMVVKFLSSGGFIERYQITVDYEETLLLTGGTILKNKSICSDDGTIVAHADNLTSFNLNDFMQAHANKPSNCVITMMTFITDEPKNCGVVELNSKGIVTSFHEKVSNPPTNLANGAVYIIDSEVLDFMESLNKDVIDFSNEVLPNFINRIFTYENKDIHIDIGTCNRYRSAIKSYVYNSPKDNVDWDYIAGEDDFLRNFQKKINLC